MAKRKKKKSPALDMPAPFDHNMATEFAARDLADRVVGAHPHVVGLKDRLTKHVTRTAKRVMSGGQLFVKRRRK